MKHLTRFLVCWLSSALLMQPGARAAQPASKGVSLMDQPLPILLDAMIGGAACKLLFDTGASISVVDPALAAQVGPPVGETSFGIADGSRTVARLHRIDQLRVGNVEVVGSQCIVSSMKAFREILGEPIDGILGMESLNQMAVFIDRDNGRLHVTKEATLTGDDWRIIGLKLVERIPVIELPFPSGAGTSAPMGLRIDTGYNGTFQIPAALFDKLVKDGVILERKRKGRAQTLLGLVDEKVGWFQSGEFMGKPLRGVGVSANHTPGNMGLEWLVAFNIVIDMKKSLFAWTPRVHFTPPVDVETMLGAICLFRDGEAVIESLKPGRDGAAEKAGLARGDTISSFGSLRAGKLSLSSVTMEVISNAGGSVPVVFQRKADGRIATASIRLPPAISSWDFVGRDLPANGGKK